MEVPCSGFHRLCLRCGSLTLSVPGNAKQDRAPLCCLLMPLVSMVLERLPRNMLCVLLQLCMSVVVFIARSCQVSTRQGCHRDTIHYVVIWQDQNQNCVARTKNVGRAFVMSADHSCISNDEGWSCIQIMYKSSVASCLPPFSR